MAYRREIDGLRAIAVVPVILFHAGIASFSGGFVGVDVFFVISGYLITSIILAEQETGTFSLVHFYERRARRILPALFAMMAACVPVAWFLLLPADLEDFSKSLVAVSSFVSNMLFYSQSGYFESDAELKPLLHTWSLGVEEQFYVLFPMLLIVLARFGRRQTIWALSVLAAASLVAAEFATTREPSAAFYLLPTRAWELGIGALLTVNLRGHEPRDALAAPLREFASALGIAMIVVSVFIFDGDTPFPGFHALLPTAGTALLILTATPATLVGRLLGSKGLVGIGLVSYSAYLWHQPLFAFARQASIGEPSHAVFIMLSISAIALAYVTWRFVEMPFRQRGRISRRAVFTFALAGSSILAGLGVAGVVKNGFAHRFDFIAERIPGYRIDNRALQAESWKPLRTLTGDPGYHFVDNRADQLLTLTDSESRKVLIIGNSHSKDLYNMFVLNPTRYPGYQFARFGLQLACIDERDPKGLFSSRNWHAASVVIVSTRWGQAGCAPFTRNASDLDGVRYLAARARSEGKGLVLTTASLEFPNSGRVTLADKLVVRAAARADQPLSAGQREQLRLRVDRLHYDLRAQNPQVAQTNAQLAELATALDLPLLDKSEYLCDSVRKTCTGVTADFHKVFFDYGHYTIDGAHALGSRAADIGWFNPVEALLERRAIGAVSTPGRQPQNPHCYPKTAAL